MEWVKIEAGKIPAAGLADIEDNDLMLFDNGEIRRYCEQWPFAIAIAYLIIPKYEKA